MRNQKYAVIPQNRALPTETNRLGRFRHFCPLAFLRVTEPCAQLYLRKNYKEAAARLAEAGCTTEQIKAITGHKTDDMAAYYAKQANQKVLAKAAMGKFEGR